MLREIKFGKCHDDAVIPTSRESGYNLYALKDTIVVGGAGNIVIPTGICAELPDNARIVINPQLAAQEHLISVGLTEDDTGGIGIIVSCTKLFDIKYIYNVLVKSSKAEYENYIDWVEVDQELDSDFNVDLSSQEGCLTNYNGKMFPSMNPHFYTIRKGERFARLII